MPAVTRGQAAAQENVSSSSSLDDSCPEFLQPFNLNREVIRALLDLGVRSSEDLLLVREADLSSVVSMIMARRLVSQFQGCVSSSTESHDRRTKHNLVFGYFPFFLAFGSASMEGDFDTSFPHTNF